MKNNKTIEISALKIFFAIAEADTLTQAAERMGITQSAVSQTLKQIEQQTETQLVITRSRPIKLTPSGQVLKNYAQQIINDTQRMLAEVRMVSKGGLLPLNIGMIDSFCDVAGLQSPRRRSSVCAMMTCSLLQSATRAIDSSEPSLTVVGKHPFF